MSGDFRPVVGPLVLAEPFDACTALNVEGLLLASENTHADLVEPCPFKSEKEDSETPPRRLLDGAIVVVKRGGCMFLEKAINVKRVRP